MSRDKLRLADFFEHILTATDRISKYTDNMTEAEFLEHPLVQDAVIRNIEVIGEACRNIESHYPQYAAEHHELPLRQAYDMRNALSHGYFSIDFRIVWRTIHNQLPDLHDKINSEWLRINQESNDEFDTMMQI